LKDADPGVRRNAAWALGRLGPDQAEASAADLVEALADGDPLVRRDVVTALGNLGDPSGGAAAAAPELARVVKESTNVLVRRNAVVALRQIGPAARTAVGALTSALRPDEARETRMFAAEALLKIGAPDNAAAMPKLIEIVKDKADDAAVRHHCTFPLGQREILDDAAAEALESVLGETEAATKLLRYEAAVYLARHKKGGSSEKTLEVLLKMVRDKGVTYDLGTSLKVNGAGTEGGRSAAEVKANSEGDARCDAARALALIGVKAARADEVLQELRKLKGDENKKVREAGEQALKDLGVD
jgi:HEAT repeat protein